MDNDINNSSQIRNRRQGVPPRYVGEDESQNHEYEDPTEPDPTEENGEGPVEPGSTEDNREDTRELGIVVMTVYSDDNNAQHNSSDNEDNANDGDSWNEEAGDGQIDKTIYDSDTFNFSSRYNSNSEILYEAAHGKKSDDESCEGRVEMKDYTEMETPNEEGIEAKKSEHENKYEALQYESSATADQVRTYAEIMPPNMKEILEENANANENQSLVQKTAVLNNNEANDDSDCTYDENKSDYVQH